MTGEERNVMRALLNQAISDDEFIEFERGNGHSYERKRRDGTLRQVYVDAIALLGEPDR